MEASKKHFQITRLSTSNLHNVICQLYLHKARKKEAFLYGKRFLSNRGSLPILSRMLLESFTDEMIQRRTGRSWSNKARPHHQWLFNKYPEVIGVVCTPQMLSGLRWRHAWHTQSHRVFRNAVIKNWKCQKNVFKQWKLFYHLPSRYALK